MWWLQDATALIQHDRAGIAFKGTEISMCSTPKAKGCVVEESITIYHIKQLELKSFNFFIPTHNDIKS